MDDRLSKIEARLRDQDAALADVRQRLARLEAHDRDRAPSPGDTGSSALPTTPRLNPGRHLGAQPRGLVSLSLIGRTCVVLGGAYLLRALTDSRAIPDSSGVALGFAYAATWFIAADHAAARRPVSGMFHGLAASAIGLSLLWEASTRFQILGAGGSAVALGLVAALGLGVAWHRRLHGLAAAAAAGTAAMAVALSVASGEPLPYALLMLGVGLAAWRMSQVCGWSSIAWPPAAASVILNVLLVARAIADPPLDSPFLVTGMLGLSAVGYLTAFTVSMSRWRQPLDAFALLQTIAVLFVGAGGCVLVAADIGSPFVTIVAAALVLAAISAYVVAQTPFASAGSADPATTYVSTVALALAIPGVAFLVTGAIQHTIWLSLAVIFVLTAWRTRTDVPALHGTAYALTAASASGVLAYAAAQWIGSSSHWTPAPPTTWPLLAIAGGMVALRLTSTAARLIIAILLTVVGGAVVVWALRLALPALADGAAGVATLRTVVLAGAAMASAAAGRVPAGREIAWLAYPALIAGAAKLLLEDFRVSPPAALFVALGAYGVGLIVTSRLKTVRQPTDAPSVT